MKIFKFGGASVNSVERIQQLPGILKHYEGEKKVVVISAMGKTTNALEKITEAFFNNQKDAALQLFEHIKTQHLNTAKYLLITTYNETYEKLEQLFTEIEWALHDKPVREYDYYYDQIVCSGELFSTAIISAYLNEKRIVNQWIDVRDIFRTNDNFREAVIEWDITNKNVQQHIKPVFADCDIVLTQGFIGATDENESTTLGREGSDYTAAVFANMMDAESVIIWKDVEGVMNADPKIFPSAKVISELNYDEVIEMAYYGAQVIHPKTIKPLQNKEIPLFVKCFLDPSLPGTIIHDKNIKHLPSIIVLKNNQALLHLHSKDFSFVGEHEMSRLYHFFAENKITPNLIQTGAVSLVVSTDDKSEKTDQLAGEATALFDVQVEKGLTLLTIRHYTDILLSELTEGKQIVLKQQSPVTVQVLMR
ncbi:aspartate kinase [Terrimonas sp.]|uniref:aspartate kinase n=1 Tax=Terrimonas sp. TaxID=1914338 RepID=UPI000D50B76D|nr:aspartate kinase [Terrimonas sp.]PVD52379.1 aspartate kinase [Terrimonas sp.]